MSERRITKGWIHFASTDENIYNYGNNIAQDKISNKMIRHQKRMNADDLAKDASDAYNAKIEAKEKLQKARKEGRTKTSGR